MGEIEIFFPVAKTGEVLGEILPIAENLLILLKKTVDEGSEVVKVRSLEGIWTEGRKALVKAPAVWSGETRQNLR